MAHSLVMAIATLEGEEDDAFAAFQRYFPGATLLIDTYDTVAAARRIGEKMKQGEMNCQGVRLDSGDLVKLSQQVRSLLPDINIFASGDIDEWEIARLKAEGAEIDGYGIGTKLVSGTPVNGVYKLVEIDSYPVMKESSGKVTYPGRKQIYRQFQQDKMQSDYLALFDENYQGSYPHLLPLMQLVMQQGKRLQPPETLEEIAQRTAASVAALPAEIRRLDQPISSPLQVSQALQQLTEKISHH
jgi:nicotinate phosphoribosyltransferase